MFTGRYGLSISNIYIYIYITDLNFHLEVAVAWLGWLQSGYKDAQGQSLSFLSYSRSTNAPFSRHLVVALSNETTWKLWINSAFYGRSGFRFLSVAGGSCLFYNVPTSFGAHATSCAVGRALSLGAERPERDVELSPPVRTEWSYTVVPLCAWGGVGVYITSCCTAAWSAEGSATLQFGAAVWWPGAPLPSGGVILKNWSRVLKCFVLFLVSLRYSQFRYAILYVCPQDDATLDSTASCPQDDATLDSSASCPFRNEEWLYFEAR